MPKTRGILKESNKNKQVNKKNESEIDKINTDFYSAMNYCIDLLLENGYISQTKNKNISREAARLGVHMYEKMMKMKGKMAHEDDHVSDDDDDDDDNDDDDIEIIEDDDDNDDEDEHEDDISIIDDHSMSIEIDDNSVIVKEEPMDINVTNNSKKTNNVINETTESTRHSTRSSKRPTKLRESFDQLNCENHEPLTTTTTVSKKRQLTSPEDIAKQDQLSEINDIVIVKCRKQIGDDRRLTNELICDWAKSAALKIKDSTFEASTSWLKNFKKLNGIFVEDTL